MAIQTGDAIEKFGTQTQIVIGGASLADGVFSVPSIEWTNPDDVSLAAFVLIGTFAALPAANGALHLYARPLNIQGVNDQNDPSATYEHIYIGSFPTDSASTALTASLTVRLPNAKAGQQYAFYIKNAVGQTLSSWDMWITPYTYGGKA